jgi:hypothetical protein
VEIHLFFFDTRGVHNNFCQDCSMYSWGASGKIFQMTKKISESFMAYEATKVFGIWKMKMQ